MAVDRQTLSQNDMRRVLEFLSHLKALLGAEAMERLMTEGIATAKRVD